MSLTIHASGAATVGQFSSGQAINLTIGTNAGNPFVNLWYNDHKGRDEVFTQAEAYKTVAGVSCAARVKASNGDDAVVHIDLAAKSFQLDINGATVAEGSGLDLFQFTVKDSSSHGTVPPAVI